MLWRPDRDALRGRVAVVAGATRGAGRGISAALGEAGATVICTGRSSVSGRGGSDYERPETIEETADLVTTLGGVGVAVQVDHLDSGQVARLAERLRRDHGRIDVLVNDIWGAEVLKGEPADWNTPIWEHDLDVGLRILQLAVDTHLVTSHHLLPLLIEQPGGLLVEVTDGTADFNASRYRISVFYDLAKVAVNRLAFSQGHELEPYGATAVAVTPGWLRSEMMLEGFAVTEDNWRDSLERDRADGPTAPPGFAESESPRFVGRAVAALAADPERARFNQRSVTSAQLAREYGFVDIDGARPDGWAAYGSREITLREATANDVDAVARIWHRGWKEAHLGHLPDALSAVRTKESFWTRAGARLADTTVAVVDGNLTGFTMVVDDELEQIYVDVEHRGSGVAGALLDAAERRICDGGHGTAWLAVIAENERARRFYARHGWIDRGAFLHAAPGPDGPIAVPACRYEKALRPR